MSKKLYLNYFKKTIFLFIVFFVFSGIISAQRLITGSVTSEGEPLIGANILVKGTSVGVITDLDGKFSLTVPKEASTLVVSYVGYDNKEVEITGNVLSIILETSKKALEEVVVVGYGTQKKSVVTGAISSVKEKDIEKLPNSGRIDNVIQGRTSGVYVAANAGQPGSSSTIRVRGLTSFNGFGGNNVLWVVDGVAISDDIGFLNQSDIESIEVLKDAASLAIYGARSASGVILVTTKKGKAGKLHFNYNGMMGFSSPERVLKMLNATEYAVLRNEKSINAGGGVLYTDLNKLGIGTDWQKQIFVNNAKRNSHEFSLSGGNDISTFYLSFGTQFLEGIVLPEISNFSKQNIRINSTHKLTKFITIGENFTYGRQKSKGIGNTNNEFGGPLSSAINLDPITPVIETDPVLANNLSYYPQFALRDANGNPYGISTQVGQEMANPIAFKQTQLGNYGYGDDFVGSAFAELSILNGLRFKTSIGGKMAYWGGQSFNPKFYFNANYNNGTSSSISRSTNRLFAWNIENTINYDKVVGNHNFTLLLGQGAYEDDDPIGMSVTHSHLPTNNWEEASFNYGVPSSDKTGYVYVVEPHRVSSLFSRLNYNYAEKYLFTGIIRRDGSTNFGSNYKYGLFPSFSLGWVVSKEGYWQENNIIQSLKIRGGYGVTGNDRLRKFSYISTVSGGRNYTFGQSGDVITIGYSPDAPANPDLKWEETRQTNVGFEARLFKHFDLTFDWYDKATVGILQTVRLPGYVGAEGNPWGNVADMKNTGIELELTYKTSINKLNIGVTGNFSTLTNNVTFLGDSIKYITSYTAGFQSMGDVTRTLLDYPYNSYFGYQTNGIFQNLTEINSYVNAEGKLLQPNAVPGDFKWVDSNGDGLIDDKDKVYLGSPIPKYTYGLTLNADYKSFDFMIFAQGNAGNKIFQGLRRLDILNANYQTVALSRWHGEGTSTDYPRLTNDDSNGNFTKMSDFYLQNGDFVRLKQFQVGYTLPRSLTNKIGIPKVRVYFGGENLLTLTKYTGYDPEIGGDISGIDKGYYPQARAFLFGLNVQL